MGAIVWGPIVSMGPIVGGDAFPWRAGCRMRLCPSRTPPIPDPQAPFPLLINLPLAGNFFFFSPTFGGTNNKPSSVETKGIDKLDHR